ncbi:MAG: hypothetical protein WD275_02175 [Rhodothermales bacterium]
MRARPHKLVVRQSHGRDDSRLRLSTVHLVQFPFKSTLSLDPLIEYWMSEASMPDAIRREIASYLEKNPELRGSIASISLLEAHRSFLDLLMLPIFPKAYAFEEPAAALTPFEFRWFYTTPAFTRLFTQDSGTISGHVNMDLRTFTYGRIIAAYQHVLRAIYDVDVPFDYPVTFTIRDPDTRLDRHFKVVPDQQFVRIVQPEKLPPLNDEMRTNLNFSDLESWAMLVPPDAFEFYGFSTIHAHDVTDEHVLTMLERALIEQGSLSPRTRIDDIEDQLRTLLRTPELELGLSVIDGNEFYLLNEPSQPLVDTFIARSSRYELSAIEKSVFQRSLDESSIQAVNDLQGQTKRAPIEDDLLRWGVRAVLAAPLYVGDETVGVLYLWSPEPSSLGNINVMKLLDVLPIFAAAVKRTREEMRNRVQDVIMGKYTAIHGSVAWRFRQAAMNFLQKHEHGRSGEVEPIVFENVYPFFAATDIRGSSEHRNEAVCQDLVEHLQLAEDILGCARETRPLAVFHHLIARIQRYEAALKRGLSSGDEAEVREFLQSDLEPIFQHLDGLGVGLDSCLKRYRSEADADSGSLYTRSRAFENSVRLVNQTISDFLDAEQEKLQPQFPHYFEKHQTDGVEFSMYAGASLLENGEFDPIHINVIRLWQLMAMCGIAARMEPLKELLEDPLETTHLIIVQNTPINIRYRFDETSFDVDGTHHVRFQIMKQRVEKALIKGSDERLTQPDRIAIVYSQEREAEEYWSYIDYLQERGFISSEVEDLQLHDLQGMKGLRALRVQIAASTVEDLPIIDPNELRAAAELLAA